jgi:hypothetical protein
MLNRISKLKSQVFPELERVSTGSTAMAVVQLLSRADAETGSCFVVEGTQTDILLPTLERYVFRDHLKDSALLDFFNTVGLGGVPEQWKIDFCFVLTFSTPLPEPRTKLY